MKENLEYGFPGCTKAQAKNHYRWCYSNGYQPYELYRQLADAVAAKRSSSMRLRALAFNQARAESCPRPKWMSKTQWKYYRQYENRAAKLGCPSITPEQWASTAGMKGRRGSVAHPGFTAEQNSEFKRFNSRRKYRGRPPFEPEQWLKWVSNEEWRSAGSRAKKPKKLKLSHGRVFKSPKQAIINKILAAAQPKREST